MAVSKADLRKTFRELKKHLFVNPELIDLKTKNLNKNLNDFFLNQSGAWGIYFPMRHEVSVLQLIHRFENIKFYFPKLQNDKMTFLRPKCFDFIKSRYGYYEPLTDHSDAISLDDLKGVIVPGLAFDVEGVRLGQGKGHYDQALKNYFGLKIGICFSEFLVEQLPAEIHDIKMTTVVTETKVCHAKGV